MNAKKAIPLFLIIVLAVGGVFVLAQQLNFLWTFNVTPTITPPTTGSGTSTETFSIVTEPEFLQSTVTVSGNGVVGNDLDLTCAVKNIHTSKYVVASYRILILDSTTSETKYTSETITTIKLAPNGSSPTTLNDITGLVVGTYKVKLEYTSLVWTDS